MKSKMLFIGFNKLYSHPNTEATLRVMSNIMSLDFFGPGYSTPEELYSGLENYFEAGDYDFLMCDSFVFEWENIQSRKNRFAGTSLFFKNELYDVYAPKLKDFFKNAECTKVFMSNWDYYNISQEKIQEIVDSDTLILGADKSVMRPYDEKIEFKTTDNWYEFSHQYDNRIISAQHFLEMNEFNRTPLNGRKIHFDVPGTEYAERKEVMRLTKLKRARHFWIQKALNLLMRVLKKKPSRDVINFFNNRFNNKIANTKICYVSGSSVKYPIRKFFEVPGKRTLMVCSEFTGMEELGFKHNYNCIILKELVDVLDVLKNYDEKRVQRIADRGLDMVLEQHSMDARISQWRSSFDLIKNGQFKGSTWVKGEYVNL